MRRALIGLVAGCIFAGIAAGQSYMVSGQEHVLWVLRTNKDGTYDLLAKTEGGKWEWISRGEEGAPTAMTAAGEGLHLFFPRGEHRVYGLKLRQGTFAPGVDGTVLAACGDEPAMQGGLSSASRVIVVALQTAPGAPPATGPATSAAPGAVPTFEFGAAPPSRPEASTPSTRSTAPARAVQMVRLVAYESVGPDWRVLGTLEGVPYSADVKVFAAVGRERLHVMIRDTAGGRNRLLVLDKEQWRDLQLGAVAATSAATAPEIAPLQGDLSSHDVLGMFAISARLVVLLGQDLPEGDLKQVKLAWAADAGGAFAWQVLSSPDKPVTWPREVTLTAGQSDRQIGVLWQEPGSQVPQLSVFDADGRLVRLEMLDIFAKPPPDDLGQEVLQYFLWAVLIAIFIPLFLVRPSGPPRPFTLPANVLPARLARRLTAAILDFVPFAAISMMVFPVALFDPADMQSAIQEQRVPDKFVFFGVSMLTLYVAYCIVMEYFFGATLGKMIFRLRVVGDEARKANLREVSLRNLSKIVELVWPIWVPILIFLPLVNRMRQRLGDMLARTAVVDAATLPQAPISPESPPGKDGG